MMVEPTLEFEVESLEQRAMLAGNVTVSVVGSNLTIAGDADGNSLKISSTVAAGTLIVHGVDGTTVNGEATQLVEGVEGRIRINLKNGDNSVLLKRENFTSFNLDRGVSIRAGSGSDVVGLYGVEVDGAASIQLGNGDNLVNFSNGQTRGLRIKTGDGNDVADLDNSNYLRGFSVRTGDGDDLIKAGFNEFFATSNTIKAGRGNDLVDLANNQFHTSRAPLVAGQSGDDALHRRANVGTGDREVGFESQLSAGEITEPIESHSAMSGYDSLFSYGAVDTQSRLEAAGSTQASSLIINAWGQRGEEQFNLIIDGQTVATYNAATTWTPFEYITDGPLTPDQIRIEFTNDLYDPGNGIDRNLFVNNIQIDGVVFETNSPDVYSTGSWTTADGVQPGFSRGIVLNANGYFQYGAGTQQTTVTVRARGDIGSEAFRIIENGELVGQFAVNSTQFRDFSVGLDRDVSAENLRVEFFNDDSNEFTGDRNLIVDYISINGEIFQTEASTTFANGVYVDGQGIQSGFLQSETLHANGFFQFLASSPFLSGTIDTNYGTDGSVEVGAINQVSAIDANGNVLVKDSLSVRLLDPNGNYVSSFGGDGIVELAELFPGTTFQTSSDLTDVVATTDGGWILSIGQLENSTSNQLLSTPVIFKLNASGNLDQSFANGGVIDQPGVEIRTDVGSFPAFDLVRVEVDSSGRVLLAGAAVGGSDRAVVRFGSNGQIDSSFGSEGIATVSLGNGPRFDQQGELAVLDDGSILSISSFTLPFDPNVGARPQGTSIWKLTDVGVFDFGYGNFSGVAIHGQFGSHYAVDGQGRVLVGSDAQLSRIDANGNLDSSYGTGGVFQPRQFLDIGLEELGFYGVGFRLNTLEGLAVDEDGRAILAVRQQDQFGSYGTMFLVVTDSGQQDASFSSDGAAGVSFISTSSLVYDSNGGIIVVTTTFDGTVFRGAQYRLLR